jgi:hypothetical protein
MEIRGSGGQKYLISSDRTNIGLFGGHIGISISNKILSFAIRDKLRFAGTRDEYGEFRRLL